MSVTQWVRTTPPSWPLARIKHVCRTAGGGTPDKGNGPYWQGDIPWVSPKDMKSDCITDTEDHITAEALANSATQMLPPNSVLMVMRSGILRHSIPVAINAVPVSLNQDMRAFHPDERLVPRFLARLIQGHQTELLQAWSKVGATVESLESDLVGDTLIPLPPRHEQEAITAFLDRETARVDSLVAAKQHVLGLLAEKRKAIIATVVTRGLDPKAKLRDSGVAWLGEIPGHWRLVPLRYLVSFLSGGTPDKDNAGFWIGGTIPWVSPKDMKIEEIDDSEDHITQEALDGSATRLVPVGSVLIVVRGMILAHTLPVAVTSGPVTINQDIKALVCGDRLLPDFLRIVLAGQSRLLLSLTDSSAHGTKKMETEVLQRLEVPVPPLSEQHAIVAHIASETAKLDAVRAATERTIALLKERRSALIAAAVTGQLAVGPAA